MRNPKPTVHQQNSQHAKMAAERKVYKAKKGPVKLSRKQLDADIEAFKNSGGKITVIENAHPNGAPIPPYSSRVYPPPKKRRTVKRNHGKGPRPPVLDMEGQFS